MISKIGQITLRVFIVVLLFMVISTLILGRLVEFRMDDEGLKAFFNSKHLEPHISYYQAKGRTVRSLEVGDQSNASVLFIHGAPSSLSYWKGYLSDGSLLKRASLYAIDR